MRFGLQVAQQRLQWPELVSRAGLADELGFHGVWGFDHFQPVDGDGPGNCFEGNTMLAALAGATNRVRLGLLVSGMTYRHPSVFAAEAITIDHASNGRFELSYGAGWSREEHQRLGIPFSNTRDRIDAFEEAIQIIRGLLTINNFTFEGRYFSVHDATLLPRPLQAPHPPIWIGASGEQRMLPIAARYADVWHYFGSVVQLLPKSRKLSDLAQQAGRDPAEITRAASLSIDGDPSRIARTIEAWTKAGFSYLVCGWPNGGRAAVEQFAERHCS